jgi:hypothetical protein
MATVAVDFSFAKYIFVHIMHAFTNLALHRLHRTDLYFLHCDQACVVTATAS